MQRLVVVLFRLMVFTLAIGFVAISPVIAQSDTQAPKVDVVGGISDDSELVYYHNMCFAVTAHDNVSGNSQIQIQYYLDSDSDGEVLLTRYGESVTDKVQIKYRLDNRESEWVALDQYPCFEKLNAGKYIFAFRVKDLAGNLSDYEVRQFTIFESVAAIDLSPEELMAVPTLQPTLSPVMPPEPIATPQVSQCRMGKLNDSTYYFERGLDLSLAIDQLAGHAAVFWLRSNGTWGSTDGVNLSDCDGKTCVKTPSGEWYPEKDSYDAGVYVVMPLNSYDAAGAFAYCTSP